MNVLPSGGSIVVIDDSFVEAGPLIQLLSKENKAYRYFDGSGSSLPPDGKFETTRLIFLDYNLTSGTIGTNNIPTIVSNLSRLIDENNGPYFIFLWSKNKNDADEFVQDLDRYIASAPHLRPHKVKAIEKLNYFEQAEDTWQFISGKQEELRTEIQTAIGELALLEFLSKWENQVTAASQKLISKVSDIVDSTDEATDSTAKVLVHHLAKINLEQSIQKLEDSDIHVAAYQTLNTVFSTYLNHKSGELTLEHEEFQNLKSLSSSNGINKCKLNSWLNINQLPNPSHLGEVFATEESYFYDWNIVKDFSNHGKFLESVKQQKTDDDYFQTVELEISPECDVAQNKRKFYRIVPGILTSVGLLKKIYNALPANTDKKQVFIYHVKNTGELQYNSTPQSIFRTPSFEFKDENNSYELFLILDLSQFKTVPVTSNQIDYFQDKQSLFSINNDMLQDIKNSLATNIQKKGYQQIW